MEGLAIGMGQSEAEVLLVPHPHEGGAVGAPATDDATSDPRTGKQRRPNRGDGVAPTR